MRMNYTSRGFRVVTFKNRCNVTFSVQESSAVTPGLWFTINDNCVLVSQQAVKALLPLLAHFAKHGALPDRKRARRVKAAANEEEGK